MFELPHEVKCNIFNFDPTFKLIFDNVLLEIKRFPYWAIASNNSCHIINFNFNSYRLTEEESLARIKYHNEVYKVVKNINNLVDDNHILIKKIGYIDKYFITDFFEYKYLLNYINLLKDKKFE